MGYRLRRLKSDTVHQRLTVILDNNFENRGGYIMTQEELLEQNDQFVISYELLYILHWILKYEPSALKELVYKAFAKGIDDKMSHDDIVSQVQNSEDIQNSIVDFFAILEDHVNTITEEATTKHLMHNQILQTLTHIDPKRFNSDTIKSSMMATAEKIDVKNKIEAKQHLLKELLKQWNPKKDTKDLSLH